MEEDPQLKLEEALSFALYSHNLQVNRNGFSPNQLMFGKQTIVPAIFYGTPASIKPIIELDV